MDPVPEFLKRIRTIGVAARVTSAGVATAIIDRPMHHGEAIVIQGESYRTKDRTHTE